MGPLGESTERGRRGLAGYLSLEGVDSGDRCIRGCLFESDWPLACPWKFCAFRFLLGPVQGDIFALHR